MKKEGKKSMNKNIEVWPDYDRTGVWCLNIRKKKGKLTLDEITQTCKEYEQDYYMLAIKAFDVEMQQYFDDDFYQGESVTLYQAGDFFAWKEKKQEVQA